ncbi:MAG: hypothetical protein ACOCXA_03485 [Planctomycetota bacterium]
MRCLILLVLILGIAPLHAAVEVISIASAQSLLEQMEIRKNDADVSQVAIAVVALRSGGRVPVEVQLNEGSVTLVPTVVNGSEPIGDQGVYRFRSLQVNFGFDPTGMPVVSEIIGEDPALDARTSLAINGEAVTESVSVAGEGISVSYPLSEAAERDVSMLLDALPSVPRPDDDNEDDLATLARAGAAFGNETLGGGGGFDIDSFANTPAPVENPAAVSPTTP